MTHNKASGSEGLSKLLSSPTLYERTGDVKDANTLLVNRSELIAASTPPLSEGAGTPDRAKQIRERVEELEAEVKRLVAEHEGLTGGPWGKVDASDMAWAASSMNQNEKHGTASQAPSQPPGCEYPHCECPIVGIAPQCGKNTGRYKPALGVAIPQTPKENDRG